MLLPSFDCISVPTNLNENDLIHRSFVYTNTQHSMCEAQNLRFTTQNCEYCDEYVHLFGVQRPKTCAKVRQKKWCTQLRVFCDLLPEKRRTRNDVVSAITRSKWQEPRKMRTNLLRIVVNHFVTRKSRHPL